MDGRNVYSSCNGLSGIAVISRVSLDGGEASTLATIEPPDGSQSAQPSRLAADAKSLYFAAGGQLYRLAK